MLGTLQNAMGCPPGAALRASAVFCSFFLRAKIDPWIWSRESGLRSMRYTRVSVYGRFYFYYINTTRYANMLFHLFIAGVLRVTRIRLVLRCRLAPL